MTFISYAQNYEDVMLYRALKNVEKGVYVDVGANDPIKDSITKAFYERGWRGINIEPIRHWYDKLVVDRPEDLNLNVAISDQSGILRLYDVQDTGLSTSSKDFAEQHSKELGFQYQEIMVPALTLDSVLQEFNREIHFLKVDVEGAEKQVLASIDLTRTRPWIILVEATKPFSQEQNFEGWEALLIDQGYTFVYFDGLNRFYVLAERNDLSVAFSSPPNVFDDFIQIKHWNIQTALDSKEIDLTHLRVELDKEMVDRANLQTELNNLSDHFQNALNEIARFRVEHDKEMVDRANLQTELNKLSTHHQNALNEIIRFRVEHDKEMVDRANLQTELNNLSAHYQNALNEITRLRAEHDKEMEDRANFQTEFNALKIELRSVYSSTSWKITAPIRYTKTVLAAIFYFPRRVIKEMLTGSVQFIRANPSIKGKLVRFLAHFPMIDRVALRLSRRVMNESALPPMAAINTSVSSQELSLSESEKHFYDFFQREIFRRHDNKGESSHRQDDKRKGDNK